MDKTTLVKKLSKLAHELENSNAHSDAGDIQMLIETIALDSIVKEDVNLIRKIREHCLSPRGYIDIGGGRMNMADWANLLNEVGGELKKIEST